MVNTWLLSGILLPSNTTKEVSQLNIGSRPASRKKVTDIDGLRAIPLGLLVSRAA